jgi:hypothetical protein
MIKLLSKIAITPLLLSSTAAALALSVHHCPPASALAYHAESPWKWQLSNEYVSQGWTQPSGRDGGTTLPPTTKKALVYLKAGVSDSVVCYYSTNRSEYDVVTTYEKEKLGQAELEAIFTHGKFHQGSEKYFGTCMTANAAVETRCSW